MIFESEFDIGELVFYMENNKVKTGRINSIKMPVFFKHKGKIERTYVGYTLKYKTKEFHDCELFKTKSLLLKSL
jgi:hypothetical protein